MAKTKQIHVTTVFDGSLTLLMWFVSLISQKYGKTMQNIHKRKIYGNEDENLKEPDTVWISGKWL